MPFLWSFPPGPVQHYYENIQIMQIKAYLSQHLLALDKSFHNNAVSVIDRSHGSVVFFSVFDARSSPLKVEFFCAVDCACLP